jgi:hypothetical protein
LTGYAKEMRVSKPIALIVTFGEAGTTTALGAGRRFRRENCGKR